MITSLRRIAKAGFINFWRNGWVSVATVLVMVITLFVIGSVMFLNIFLVSTLEGIQDKVDVNVYFKTDADEASALSLKNKLLKMDEVKDVSYISKEEALANFKERHKNNVLINQSLEELNENPLGGVLNIKAKDPTQYESINKFLTAGAFDGVIDKVNYNQNKIVINRLSNILVASRRGGAGISIVMIVIAILVAFNTIRLAIFTNKDEISVMRLVGAGNGFIRGPFVIEGILQGVFASAITLAIFFPLTRWLAPHIEKFFGIINIYNYFLTNIFQIFGILLAVGVMLGTLSSAIAIRRYLRI